MNFLLPLQGVSLGYVTLLQVNIAEFSNGVMTIQMESLQVPFAVYAVRFIIFLRNVFSSLKPARAGTL